MAPVGKPARAMSFSGAAIVTPPSPHSASKPRSGVAGSRPGNHTPQYALMELKHRILTAIRKLADRDTQQIAADELDKIIDTMSGDCISICLSCLYDCDMQQKSIVKKECVRLFSRLASRHGDLLTLHVSKIIASIIRCLRDPDSSVRDACIDGMGILSGRMLSPSTGQENGAPSVGTLTLVTFSKPLFDALNEQNKSVQTGAAMCLARVVESAKESPLGAMSRLCPRICKFMSNPNFVARPALLSVIGSLSQVGALGQQQLDILMPRMHEALENSDWATRKAAAETLTHVCSNLGLALVGFKSTTLEMLESCRFDKVKPVRDSVHDATQQWKSLPSEDGCELNTANSSRELQSPTPVSKEINLSRAEAVVTSEPLSIPNGLVKSILESAQTRAPAFTDTNTNLDFCQNFTARSMDDSSMETSVRNNGSLSACEAIQVALEKVDDAVASEGGVSLKKSPNCSNEVLAKSCPSDRGSASQSVGLEQFTDDVSSESHESYQWDLMFEQLSQLSQQQALLMQMVQDFMSSSQETMYALQVRIQGLDQMVDDMACHPRFSLGRKAIGIAGCAESDNIGSSSIRNLYSNVHVEGHVDNFPTIETRVQHSAYEVSEHADHARGVSGLSESYLLDDQAELGKCQGPSDSGTSNVKGGTGVGNIKGRQAWDTTGAPVRFGEGPSARSVWQASNDEATLAAIRVASKDVSLSEAEGFTSGAANLVPSESSLETELVNKSDHSKGLWILWNAVMEFVHAGDMESAYSEVLCSGHVLMLVRLMRRTGPVLDQLTGVTASEVIRAIGQLLQQQNFFQACFAWVQQLADMVASNGGDCVDVSLDVKKDILMCLQETVGSDLPDGWVDSTIELIAQQLATGWSAEMVQAGRGM